MKPHRKSPAPFAGWGTALRRVAAAATLGLATWLNVSTVHAMSYDITTLSLGGSMAEIRAMNGAGLVVGIAGVPNGAVHAFAANRADGMVDLGTLGGPWSYADAVNASNQVVGHTYLVDTSKGSRAFIWTKAGGMKDLGTFGGTSTSFNALLINDAGLVAGSWDPTGYNGEMRTFVWTEAGGLADIGTLGGKLTVPWYMSSAGHVVGIGRVAPDAYPYHAYLWSKATGIIDLGVLPGGQWSQPTAVNANGEVVGISYMDDGTHRGFYWSASTGMIDIGTIGQPHATPYWIFDDGRVFGYSEARYAYLFSSWVWTKSGGMVDMGSFGGGITIPRGVTKQGKVVGESYFDPDVFLNRRHAFSWTAGGGLVDLGTLGGGYSIAEAVNDSDQIVGFSGGTGDGSLRAFISDGGAPVDLATLLANKPAGFELLDAYMIANEGAIVAASNVGPVLLSPHVATPVAAVVAPIVANDPVAVGATLSARANFTDADTADTHTAQFAWGDGTAATAASVTEGGGSGSAAGTHIYAAAGVYPVTLAVTDSGGKTGTVTANVAVYDASAGFVTGNGWIVSPPGAFKADPSLAGRAMFGFVAKYQKGAKVPTGTTQFRFTSADLDFASDQYEWLVVSGARAQFKGAGTLNGVANHKFLLTAVDGQVAGGGGTDRFRIRIWRHDDAAGTDVLIYDNQLSSSGEGTTSEGTAIGAGSIVVHAN